MNFSTNVKESEEFIAYSLHHEKYRVGNNGKITQMLEFLRREKKCTLKRLEERVRMFEVRRQCAYISKK